ncbi:MAG: lipoate--protein ligase family protein [Roseiflexaceae bacterium]
MHWRLLIDAPADGATNMARDAALLDLCASGAAPPTLRLYGWTPACLSLGRFQRSAEVRREACAQAGVAVVRRPSGGRALLHDAELTYALVAPAGTPPLDGAHSILESYRLISAALLAGLHRLGAPAELAPVARRRGGSAACFDMPASYELTMAGRKLAGSAQARSEGALLQHGAIPLTGHAARLAGLLAGTPPDLDQKMIALDEATGRAVTTEEAVAAIAQGFAVAWDITLTPGDWSPAEQARAAELRTMRYTAEEWTWGR